MPSARGGHKVKVAKPASNDAPTNAPLPSTKPIRKNTDWKTGLSKPSFLSRTLSEPKQSREMLSPSSVIPDVSCQQAAVVAPTGLPAASGVILRQPKSDQLDEGHDLKTRSSTDKSELCQSLTYRETSSDVSPVEEQEDQEMFSDTFQDLTLGETQSCSSSVLSRDRFSIFSADSVSIYSSTSSIYSSGASMYSLEEDAEECTEARMPGNIRPIQRTRTNIGKRPEIQDAASRERSSLAKKAAMFKNSKLPPDLPDFSTTLPMWSLICRAVRASQDCYDAQALTRRGTYTPANTSKDTKAMIVDDQLIDDSRFIIVSIRGTEAQSLADWSTNKDANPVKPVGFLDDEDNACHAGFLQVAKAMVEQVATQLHQHPALSERPSLLFTGHSAGGAVAAMLYSHILSTSVHSSLTNLANQYSNIHCITFGAPPLSLTPLPNRSHGSGMFLSFANQGDPVLRLSDAAYMKSLAKLMTTSPPSTAVSITAAPPVKIIRSSRGTRVIRTKVTDAALIPWEELPVWPTPSASLTNAGEVILLRDSPSGAAMASPVSPDELKDVIFGDFQEHYMAMYIRRVKDLAFSAMMGRSL